MHAWHTPRQFECGAAAGQQHIAVTDAIKKILPQLQAQIPPSVKLGIRGDRSKNIREAFQDIQFTMAATLGLVVLVIFLFLRISRPP